MADEILEQPVNDGGEKLDETGLPDGSASVTGGYDAPQDVVEVQSDSSVYEDLDFASSDLPYHTAETEKIAEERAKEAEGTT